MNNNVNQSTDAARGTPGGNEGSGRFFALDCVRATAMTLGVLYHALLFGGGMMMMGFGSAPTFSSRLMDWIHSFRMPLFFLISGFFSHMMMVKYGWRRYFLRRYWRIAVPLLIVLFALGGIRAWNSSGGRGGPPGGFERRGPGFNGPGMAGNLQLPGGVARGDQPAGAPLGSPGFPVGDSGSRPPGGMQPGGPQPGGFGGPPPEGGSGDSFGPGGGGGGAAAVVTGTKDPGLFQNEHWGMSAFSSKVANGPYLAKLYFAETYAGISGPGERVFSLNVQGHEIKDFDVWVKAGGPNRAYIETVPVEVTNGEFRILFTSQVENPAIKAIELLSRAEAAKGASSSAPALRIKAGQSAPFTDSNGQVWKPDEGFEGGGMSLAIGGAGPTGFPAGGAGFRPGGRMGGPFGGGAPLSAKLFGGFSRNLNLQHLWFLWYLLVFATVGPVVTFALGWILEKTRGSAAAARAGAFSLQWGLAPLVLGLVSVVGLLLSGTAPGRPPGGYAAIMGVFPDVFLHYDSDWAYFFIYFLGGWSLYALRDRLGEVAKFWLPTLAVGFGAYAASVALAGNGPGFFMGAPQRLTASDLARHALFAIAVAGTSFGLMGFFQRYFNRPTKAGRYLADTAFWVYIVHQDLMNMVVLNWVRPWRLPPLCQALATVAITTAIALVVFELVIRPTPLTNLFGPPQRKKPKVASAPVGVVPTEMVPP